MKITIPPPIVLDLNGQRTERSLPWLISSYLDDPIFGADVYKIESRVAIREAFSGKETGDVVDLRGSDWELLARAVRTPTVPYVPSVGEQLLPFIYAILRAE